MRHGRWGRAHGWASVPPTASQSIATSSVDAVWGSGHHHETRMRGTGSVPPQHATSCHAVACRPRRRRATCACHTWDQTPTHQRGEGVGRGERGRGRERAASRVSRQREEKTASIVCSQGSFFKGSTRQVSRGSCGTRASPTATCINIITDRRRDPSHQLAIDPWPGQARRGPLCSASTRTAAKLHLSRRATSACWVAEPRRSAVPAVPWCTAVPGVPGVPAVPRTRYTKPTRVRCTAAVPAVPLLYRCCTCCTAVPAVPHRKQAHVGHYKVHHTSHTPPPCLGRCTTMVVSIISWMVMI